MGISSSENGASWVFPLRPPLKPIYTTPSTLASAMCDADDDGDGDTPTTPTSEASRIPSKLPCPPPPRKRKPSPIGGAGIRCKSTNKLYNGKREFFVTPADLEAVFIRRHNVGC